MSAPTVLICGVVSSVKYKQINDMERSKEVLYVLATGLRTSV